MLFARDVAKQIAPKIDSGWLKEKKNGSELIQETEIDQKTQKTDNVTEGEGWGGAH